MICLGVTHCIKCHNELKDYEYGYCEDCCKEEENDDFITTGVSNTIKQLGRLELNYKTFINNEKQVYRKPKEIEICMWDEIFTHKWQVASFDYDEKYEGYKVVGNEYLMDVVDWESFGKLVKYGYNFLENC